MRRTVGSMTIAVAMVVATGAAGAAPRNDYLLVLDRRAGPYRYLDSFRAGRPGAYAAAVSAFGEPASLRRDANLCRATWPTAGITIGFAGTACTRSSVRHGAWYGLSLFGAKWHTRVGIRIGDPVAKVRRLYPGARFEAVGRERRLVLLHLRDQELLFVHLAVRVSATGRVLSIEVPATYIF